MEKGIRISVKEIDKDRYEIVRINGLTRKELPGYYLNQYPNVVIAESDINIGNAVQGITKRGIKQLFVHKSYSVVFLYEVGYIISRDELEKLLYVLDECGERLAYLNKQHKREEDKNKQKIITFTF